MKYHKMRQMVKQIRDSKCKYSMGALIYFSKNAFNPYMRLEAAEALIGRNDYEALEALKLLVLSDANGIQLIPKEEIRTFSYAAISQINDNRAAKALIEFMGNEEYIARRHIIMHLQEMGKKWYMGRGLPNHLAGEDASMQIFAIYNTNLFIINNREYYTGKLEGFLTSERSDYREAAAYALGDIMSYESGNELLNAYQKENNSFVKANIIRAISKVKQRTAIPLLLEALHSEVFYIRMQSATALGNIQAPEAINSLIKTLDDEEFNVASAANKALEKITYYKAEAEEWSGIRESWQKWWEENKHKYEQMEESSVPDVETKAPAAAPAQ
ncbi:MAG: HEAT repeat domain-containing protein [Nitrospinota bacterium]|nr:HEAT repeat domain-containing protein [Nitrospinota bacterium]